MKALKHDEIKGNWASLFLKIKDDESIDYSSLDKLIDYYISCGVSGIYSNGTACEFYSQTFEEFKTISDMLAAKCEKNGMPFQIGASHMSAQESLKRVEYAASLKPGAIQVILPDWSPANRKEQISFLKRVEQAADGIGIVIYNPPHAKVVLTPKDYKEILEHVDCIVGIKTAAGDEAWYESMKEVMKKVSVFIPGHFLATGTARGAQGSYSNIAAISPKAAQKWYNMAQTDIGKAMELQSRILEFMNAYIVPFITEDKYSGQACDKFMATMGGWCDMTPRLRWPYKGIEESEAARVREAAENLLPEFF